jgi:hypothetical protein
LGEAAASVAVLRNTVILEGRILAPPGTSGSNARADYSVVAVQGAN